MFKAIKSAFRREEKAAAMSYDQLAAVFSVGATAAGVAVNPETALKCPAVYASVKVLAESVAQLPLILYRRTEGGGKERATDHPLYSVLHDEANDWTDAFSFRMEMQAALCTHGKAFAFVNRAGGQVAELIQLPSPAVTVETDPLTMEPSYTVTLEDGSQRRYDRSEILHLQTLRGLSPVLQAAEAIGLSMALEQHAARLLGNGARPSGVLKYDKFLGPEMVAKMKAAFSAAHGGGESGKTLVLEDGMSFEPLSFTSVDMQFQEMRRFQIGEIARVFRLPLHMLQDLERTTHNNAEHLGQQYVALTLMPWLKLWEQGLRRALLSPEERGEYVVEFLVDDLTRAALAERFSAYATAIREGFLSPNEARAADNRPPYDGGDAFHRPVNTAPTGTEAV